VSDNSPKVEAAVWRLAANGLMISSVVERHAADIAASDPDVIYFYADLGSPTELTTSDKTVQKVYDALANVGLSEGQVINAVSAMQSSGILFRERAV
jgi:transketolase C-terminal domain/subunit